MPSDEPATDIPESQTVSDAQKVHHDRKATTAADTFHDDRPAMHPETAQELLDKLRQHGYDVRLCVEACHEDSAVVKTIDNEQDAQTTLANIALKEDHPKEGDDAE